MSKVDHLLQPEEILERRRLVRVKGREDAMFSSILMSAVTREIDLTDDEDELEKLERGDLPDAPSALMQMVVKACAPKPSGSSQYDVEWIDSINKKLLSFEVEDALPIDKVTVCQYCRCTERDLSSCFVQMDLG